MAYDGKGSGKLHSTQGRRRPYLFMLPISASHCLRTVSTFFSATGFFPFPFAVEYSDCFGAVAPSETYGPAAVSAVTIPTAMTRIFLFIFPLRRLAAACHFPPQLHP